MMGRTHALSGTLAFGGAALALHGTVDATAAELVAGAITATGAAMVPDLDHPNATMTKSMGPLSWLVCRLVILPVFDGHRKGTHSILFAALVGMGAYAAAQHQDTLAGQLVMWLLLALSWSALIRLLRIPGWLDDVIPSIVAAALVWLTDWPLDFAAPALALGCLVHVAGDCLTDKGCPLLWPVSKAKFTLGLFSTNGPGEFVATVVILVGLVAESIYAIKMGVFTP